MYLALRRTRDTHSTDTVNTGQRVGHTVIKDLVQAGHTLFSLYRQQTYGYHVGREFENYRILCSIRQHRLHHVEFVSDIICEHVNIVTIFKFQCDNRSILSAL